MHDLNFTLALLTQCVQYISLGFTLKDFYITCYMLKEKSMNHEGYLISKQHL